MCYCKPVKLCDLFNLAMMQSANLKYIQNEIKVAHINSFVVFLYQHLFLFCILMRIKIIISCWYSHFCIYKSVVFVPLRIYLLIKDLVSCIIHYIPKIYISYIKNCLLFIAVSNSVTNTVYWQNAYVYNLFWHQGYMNFGIYIYIYIYIYISQK